jgi:hypothetical protein
MSLPPDRFATGTAVFGMARQLGSAIGVAVLVALLADPSPAQLFDHLERGWVFALGTGVAAGALALAIGPPRRERRDARVDGLAPQEGSA